MGRPAVGRRRALTGTSRQRSVAATRCGHQAVRHPGVRRHHLPRGHRALRAEQGPRSLADAVPLDDQSLPWLQSCVCLLPIGRDANPHDRRSGQATGRDSRRGRIYGTEREGSYRRYVPTTVLAHWQTIKPAYRVILCDGTTLVASGDHRFLTDRGWKHVTGAMSGSPNGPISRPATRCSASARWSRHPGWMTTTDAAT